MKKQETNDRTMTDQAWEKLKVLLVNEPLNNQWTRWTAGANKAEVTADAATFAFPATMKLEGQETDAQSKESHMDPLTLAVSGSKRGKPSWLKRRKRWLGAVTATSVLTFFVATPVGSKALTSLLNQFRVQELTVVQREDVENLFHGVVKAGVTEESINKFGTFTFGPREEVPYEPVSYEVANQWVNGKFVLPKTSFDKKNDDLFRRSAAHTITFQMNVNEINGLLKRLGAKKLIPESVDGKTITLHTGNVVQLYKRNDESNPSISYNLRQQPVPELKIDPSIPVSEAMEALIQFPLLPENLKKELQSANVLLKNGSVPLPFVANEKVEQIDVNGTPVILEKRNYPVEQSKYTSNYSATWIKDGMLLELSGESDLNKDELMKTLKELIHP